jgi:hypothetical protein
MSNASDELPDALRSIRTQSLFVMRLSVRPLQIIGATPGAFRRVGVTEEELDLATQTSPGSPIPARNSSRNASGVITLTCGNHRVIKRGNDTRSRRTCCIQQRLGEDIAVEDHALATH